MQIQTASVDHADELVDQWVALASDQRTHGSHLFAESNRPVIREYILQCLIDDAISIALENNDIIGFVMYRVEQERYDQDVTRGVVENLYVDPEQRNNGVGAALMDAAETELVTRGVDVITLEIMAQNEAAARFYERHGYHVHRVVYEKPVETDNVLKEER